ncbi:MAG: radical SAM protein [Candidatus Eremiobacter antarcticus]|nr:radical SAM protein [Candidatus Eremiobacteraeota bacterium]
MRLAEAGRRRSPHTARPAEELRALFATRDGAVLDSPSMAAAVDGGLIEQAQLRDFIPLPPGTLLLQLPGRSPLRWARGNASPLTLPPQEPIDAVAAVLPLGYTRTLLPAYETRAGAPVLPLYGYAAVAWSASGLVTAAERTDAAPAWSQASHDTGRVRRGIAALEAEFPANAVIAQLKRCATEYGCFTAQNVFLRQGEAALPVSPACNARCLGCISAQEPGANVPSAQERFSRAPLEADIVAVAIAHLQRVPDGMISFGQGCEGEPLLAAPLIERAIRAVRKHTQRGIIHCNTNGSRPDLLARLLDAGLQSIRVSLNSARPEVYAAYYRPRGYAFADVLQSLETAGRRGAAISLNLLTHPGVTDTTDEMDALADLLSAYPISMVQTRTLNIDPQMYFQAVGRPTKRSYGMRRWLAWLRANFAGVRVGNFTRGFG